MIHRKQENAFAFDHTWVLAHRCGEFAQAIPQPLPCAPKSRQLCAFFGMDTSAVTHQKTLRLSPHNRRALPRILAGAQNLKEVLLNIPSLQICLFYSSPRGCKKLFHCHIPQMFKKYFFSIILSISYSYLPSVWLLCQLKVILFNSHICPPSTWGYILVTLQVLSSPFYSPKSRKTPQ